MNSFYDRTTKQQTQLLKPHVLHSVVIPIPCCGTLPALQLQRTGGLPANTVCLVGYILQRQLVYDKAVKG